MENRKKLPHDHGNHIEQALEQMPDEASFQQAAFTFQQLCDGTRLRILWLLCHCEECVSNLAAAVAMSDPAVSHHLRVLRQSGLISSRREGREVYYTLTDSPESQLVHRMIDDYFELKCPVPYPGHIHFHTAEEER